MIRRFKKLTNRSCWAIAAFAWVTTGCDRAPKQALPQSLHDAAVHAPEHIAALIAEGHDVNNTNHMFGNPLLAAVRFGKTASVKALLEHKADPDIPDANGHLPLPYAAREKQWDIVRLLVDHEAAINRTGHYGRPALHYAAIEGDLSQAALLIDKGADLSLRDEPFGFTPLLCAVNAQQADMVAFLIAQGSAVDAKDHHGNTAADIARHKDPAIFNMVAPDAPAIKQD